MYYIVHETINNNLINKLNNRFICFLSTNLTNKNSIDLTLFTLVLSITRFITKTTQNRIHFIYDCEIAKLDPLANLKGFVLENITSIQNVEPEFIAFFIFSALFYKVSTNMIQLCKQNTKS